ncbi:MAG: bifunctional phosphopantothenoylcysteine decarboxylase/phosphopantothenate--cysteine ligase CoaBC [Nitrospirae bacterium]|nr:bifunctional phosphopantothenoylcysteine decarboxylase/phosphopantothenate--cysteine ligase CoaBC [Nitrospirota bacterium]
MLKGKRILLGVTGSIAAYKSVEIVRRLVEGKADVTVIMTEAACRFVQPLTFESVSGNPVFVNPFEGYFKHIELIKKADLFLVAPASANTINKFACGIADNLLSTAWLSYEGPSLVAPAMNSRMYKNPVVQKSIKELARRGVIFAGPETGDLACGEEGIGRLSEVSVIVEHVKAILADKDLKGHRILITAGPTREALDPVRFLSNRSSGKMGFALAEVAVRRGADVTLISGPTALKPPADINFIPVESARDMGKAAFKVFPKSTSVIMAAAVCDFAPAASGKSKFPKSGALTINLKGTPDILQMMGRKKGRRILVGFAAESGKDIKRAMGKLNSKNLDLIILNDITQKGAGFDVDTNIVTMITKKGETTDLPKMKKEEVANIILDSMIKLKSKN